MGAAMTPSDIAKFSLLTRQSGSALFATRNVDVCVYGATASGIMAAVSAAQNGKTVELINPDNVFGGMPTQGGLSYTDRAGGDCNVVKGLTNALYRQIWNANYTSNATDYPTFWGQSLNASPKAMAAQLTALLASSRITVRENYRVVPSAVKKSGTQIVSATFEDALTPLTAPQLIVTAAVYIDATYEGDLMAATGCSFAVGRESNTQYNEAYNGAVAPYNKAGAWQIDPYVTPGVASSGLLPGVNESVAAVGTGDSRVQAYGFRVNVVSTSGGPGTYRKFPEPANYNPLNYEILGRQFAAGQIAAWSDNANPPGLFNDHLCKDGVTDLNAGSALQQLDFIGGADAWPTASYAQRAAIYQQHVDWTLGLFKFLREDARVPAAIKTTLAGFGLPPYSQMPTHNGLPKQLYVREGRRMIGDFVMTDRHCRRLTPVTDGVCVGYYAMDSHHCQTVVYNGYIALEGGFFQKTQADGQDGRYWISYKALCPKAAECTNLLVTFAVSASHAAFASIRVEPIAMQLGEAAGFAAARAIDLGTAVQAVDPYKIREAMGYYPASALVLDVPQGANVAGSYDDPAGNGQVVVAGEWIETQTLASFGEASIYGPTYLSDDATNKGSCSVEFRFNLQKSGTYGVYVFYPESTTRAGAVPHTVTAGGVAQTAVNVNQINSGAWRSIGTFAFTANDPANNKVVVSNTGTTGYVVADAVALVPLYFN
ncbi:FAD-dependent oxidoreductase [Paraburkholderia sp.]|uniref:FAD-dependent oxidoreductase n=1 Tax=Paraburkholderia sp. TaxID=1926495 RepID=UPI0039E7145E